MANLENRLCKILYVYYVFILNQIIFRRKNPLFVYIMPIKLASRFLFLLKKFLFKRLSFFTVLNVFGGKKQNLSVNNPKVFDFQL